MITLLRLGVVSLLMFIIAFGYELRLGVHEVFERAMSILMLPGAVAQMLGSRDDLAENMQLLMRENQELGAVIFALQHGIDAAQDKRVTRAPVHVRSAFNVSDTLTIGAGTEQGVRLGGAVLVAPHIFLGKVTRASDVWSEIETIYDYHYEVPVRIGTLGVPGLLKGGREPRVTMIGKNKSIAPGDVVYAADRMLTYGLKIGTIRSIISEATSAFHEAEITLPYSIDDLEFVLIPI